MKKLCKIPGTKWWNPMFAEIPRFNNRFKWLSAALFVALSCVPLSAATYESSAVFPPKPLREFRGAWIPTVANIDWPSKPGLPVEQQKLELLQLLDRAAQMKLNAVVFQVRPACDAMYASRIEPWSEYLTGTMGRAPQPYYDPLQFAIEEAHKRGLELHAWFNPYRALHFSSKSPISANHVSKTRPDLVRHYGRYLWLDPGERDVQDYTLSVVMDVVRRYDVDGIHFDDYFYPYAETNASGKDIDFPDEASWKKYGVRTGLSRDDWRRSNVDAFIERTYSSIKAAKPWVKFGVSPFGIWRPKNPPQIQGYDSFAKIYADARKWLLNGWLDYFAPQLYWPIAKPEQSFPALLDWWNLQNPKHRHIWPGLNTVKALDSWKPSEILEQIEIASKQPVSAGHIHYDLKALIKNPALQASLAKGPYSQEALVPASPWMGRGLTNRVNVVLSGQNTHNLRLAANPPKGEFVSRWVLQIKTGDKWTTEFLPGGRQTRMFDDAKPELIALTPIDRFGNAGAPVVYQRKEK